MPDIRTRRADLIYGRGVLAGESIASRARRAILSRVSDLWSPSHFGRDDIAIEATRRILERHQEILAEALLNTNIAGWLAGASTVATKIPTRMDYLFFEGGGNRPPWRGTPIGGDGNPIVRFPIIDNAVDDLFSRKIVTRPDFDAMLEAEKTRAFTIAGDMSESAIGKVRDILARSVEDSPSLRDFKARLGSALESSFLGPSHVENVYRSNVQAAYANGHDKVADNPIIKRLFPYQAYLPIKDKRCRPEHAALATLGISGTNVYRRDDPFWKIFRPPWDYNCRCGVALLTVEAAARLGALEAKLWSETGNEPLEPDWRLDYIPFRPTNDFVSPGAAR